ncbi:hypothetical protein ScPMuIL_003425 [Solemya velum]
MNKLTASCGTSGTVTVMESIQLLSKLGLFGELSQLAKGSGATLGKSAKFNESAVAAYSRKLSDIELQKICSAAHRNLSVNEKHAGLFSNSTVTQKQAWQKISEEMTNLNHSFAPNDCDWKFRSTRSSKRGTPKQEATSLKEVKEELRKRGAKLSGRKLDLVERLEAYDRNQNFGFEALQDDYQIITPDSSLYKDMNADTVFTNFKQETIDIYLAKFDKKLEANARNLYSERFIKFICLAISDILFYVGSQCMAEMKKFPIAQVFSPANTYAAAEDHDYSKLSQADIWLEQMNILKISPRDIALIEYGTRGQSSNEVWFSERITSSLFGRICKATSQTDFPNLACSLTTVNKFSCPSVDHGRGYESLAIERYERTYRCSTSVCGMFVSREFPYLAASPDRIVDDQLLVEVKCPYVSRDKIINPSTVPYLYMNDSGADVLC